MCQDQIALVLIVRLPVQTSAVLGQCEIGQGLLFGRGTVQLAAKLAANAPIISDIFDLAADVKRDISCLKGAG